MTTERDFESAKPSIISSWTGSERSWKKSRRAECRGPSLALQRDSTTTDVWVEHPIALKMGKEVESWVFSPHYRNRRGKVMACHLEETARDLFNEKGAVEFLIDYYGHKRTDVFYTVRFADDIWQVLPEADIKVIPEDYSERSAIAQHAGLPGKFLSQYQHDLPLKTADGGSAKLGCRVTTKKLGLPVTAKLVGVEWKHSGLQECRCEDRDHDWFTKQWDRHYPNWRENDICILRVDGGQRFMSFKEYLDLARDLIASADKEEWAVDKGAWAEQEIELEIESLYQQLRKQYESLSGDEYRYWTVPVADVELIH